MNDMIQQLASMAFVAFEGFQRDGSDRTAYKLKDSTPDWFDSSAMMAIHAAVDGTNHRMPDDWVYDKAMDAFGYFADGGDEEGLTQFAIDSQDTYHSDLLEWMKSGYNAALVEEACDELGVPADIFQRIQYGQYVGIQRIAHAVLELLQEMADIEEEVQA